MVFSLIGVSQCRYLKQGKPAERRRRKVTGLKSLAPLSGHGSGIAREQG